MSMSMTTTTVPFSSSIPRPTPPITLPPFSSSSSSFCCSPNFALFKRATIAVTTTTNRRKKGLTCNALFGLGVPELVVIAGVAALVFGPKKLPEVGRSIGKTVKSFQQVFPLPQSLLFFGAFFFFLTDWIELHAFVSWALKNFTSLLVFHQIHGCHLKYFLLIWAYCTWGFRVYL